MDLSTTPRRAAEGVGDLQKTRVAKSVFSIRSLVDVEETELPAQDDERSPKNKIDCIKFLLIRTDVVFVIKNYLTSTLRKVLAPSL
ncbi:Uncharacterized protein DBV15_08855 [Temnothorax longispinosus]|uniref:Uncharacterized protein n=1 Tax=Temnothorax longispinosus TaxID=300112 RepID=A0A4S2L153_9HYME|nr:Uncharacterized protein DBV15_08855 [Temnothorax longispinosus]